MNIFDFLGDGTCSFCGKIVSEHNYRCQSCAGKGRIFSENHKNNISKVNLGKIFSEDTLKKMSVMASKRKGYKHSEITKKKLSISKMGDKNPSKRLDVRLKLSNATRNRYKNHPELQDKWKEFRKTQVTKKENTKIELKIQDHLKALGVDFFTHHYMSEINHPYQCDIYVPAMELIIECDGDYWHKYPVGNDLDHIRTSELLSKGFKVLRLWEHEIKLMSKEDLKTRMEVLR